MKSDIAPIPMRLPCEKCGELHIDEGVFATRAHRTHVCQACGLVWRPALVATVGVRFLPGYKDEPAITAEDRARIVALVNARAVAPEASAEDAAEGILGGPRQG